MRGGFDIKLATFDTLIARLLEGADALGDAGTRAPTTVTAGLGGAATGDWVGNGLSDGWDAVFG